MKKRGKKAVDELNRTHYSIAKNVWYCLGSTAECYWPLLCWCLLAVFLNVGLAVLSACLPKIVIGKIMAKSSLWELVAAVLGLMGAMALLTGLGEFFTKFVYHQKYRMNTFYLRRVALKGLTTDYSNQEDAVFRKLQTESFMCCNGNYSPLSNIYDCLMELFTAVFGLSVFWAILSRLSGWLILFLVAAAAVSFLLNQRMIAWTAKNSQERIGYQQRMDYINATAGDIRAAKDIRLYHMAVWFTGLYEGSMAGLCGWYRRFTNRLFGVVVCDGGMALLREGAVFIYLLSLVWQNRISAADFMLYVGVMTGFSQWLSGLFSQAAALSQMNLKINYFRSYLEYPENYRRKGGREALAGAGPKVIELKNVGYRYEGSDQYALRGVNLRIAPGEHLAVVGLNGAGKTTLVKLICGLTDPSEGQVLYDGVDVREYNRTEFYRLFCAVFQQFSILPVTIEEIVSEAPVENTDQGRVASCLKTAGLWEKIRQLPDGAKSQFGKTIYDDGAEFSGGEVQKLLLARALYKSAPILLLDEPTAALDPIAESRIYENYNQIAEGKTSVFISHRLASTGFCDRILLLEGGAVCEEGTHAGLLARKGKYYRLFEMQAKYYREKSSHAEGRGQDGAEWG